MPLGTLYNGAFSRALCTTVLQFQLGKHATFIIHDQHLQLY